MSGIAVPTDSTNERQHRRQLAQAVNKSLADNSATLLQTAEALALANTVAGDLLIEAATRESADDVINSSLTSLTSTVAGNTADITTESITRANADTAIAATVTALTATVGTNTANITTEQGVRATADSALASSITSLTATVGGNTAAITTEATARASADGSIMAEYTVTTTVLSNGRRALAGLKLIAGASGASEIDLIASKVSIYDVDPVSGSLIGAIPFSVHDGAVYVNALYAGSITTDQLTVGGTLISNALLGASSVATPNIVPGSVTQFAIANITASTAGNGSFQTIASVNLNPGATGGPVAVTALTAVLSTAGPSGAFTYLIQVNGTTVGSYATSGNTTVAFGGVGTLVASTSNTIALLFNGPTGTTNSLGTGWLQANQGLR